MANKEKDNAKTLNDFADVIVELVDRKSCFNEPVQKVMFTEGSLVQKVKRTPQINRAIVGGSLKEVDAKRLTEWEKEREEYLLEHTAKAKKVAEHMANLNNAGTDKVKAANAKTATALAENQMLAEQLKKQSEQLAEMEKKLAESTKEK